MMAGTPKIVYKAHKLVIKYDGGKNKNVNTLVWNCMEVLSGIQAYWHAVNDWNILFYASKVIGLPKYSCSQQMN